MYFFVIFIVLLFVLILCLVMAAFVKPSDISALLDTDSNYFLIRSCWLTPFLCVQI